MKSVIRTAAGGPEVLQLVERPVPEPGPGEVRVRVHVSGVNPTDWRSRRRPLPPGTTEQVPHQDGAGVIDAVGPGVEPTRIGERVWIWEAAWQRPWGTAQQYTLVPERHAVALPDHAPFDLGAALGIPALTAHRALTVHDGGPGHLAPGTLRGATVLVAVVAYYSGGEDEHLTIPVLSSLPANLRWQGVFVYTVPPAAKQQAVTDVAAAVDAGALRVGQEAGLALHRFPLERTADAHTALERGVVGKVLIDVP